MDIPDASSTRRRLIERLGLWLEFHPLVACYQRADLRKDQVAAWRLNAPFGSNLPIAFRFDDQELFHYPDYQGRWIDGTPFVADAGTFESLVSGRDEIFARVVDRAGLKVTRRTLVPRAR